MPEFYMILARKVEKYPNFYDICPKKNNKIPEFCMIFARKMPEFSIKIARKIFSRILGGTCAPRPCPRLLRLRPMLVSTSSQLFIVHHSFTLSLHA